MKRERATRQRTRTLQTSAEATELTYRDASQRQVRGKYPTHYEYGEEEWVLVLEGQASVRTPGGVERLGPFEVAFFERGPSGAHQIRNDSEQTVRLLMWSNIAHPTATAYPDSDKVGVYTGDEAEDVIVLRSSKVDYFYGEGDAR